MRPGFRVLKPIIITSGMLESDAPADGYPEWSSDATYAAKARVIDGQTIYQSTADENTGNLTSDIVKWTRVGAVNKWRAFDLKHSTRTTADRSLTFTVTPGRRCQALALLNLLRVHTVKVTCTVPTKEAPVYDKTFALGTGLAKASWYAFFFGERSWKTNFRLVDLPLDPRMTITVTLTGIGTVGCGVFLVGRIYEIGGGPHYGARLSMRDSSRYEPDDFGEYDLHVGAYNDTPSYVIRVDNKRLTEVKEFITSIRGTPVYCIASDDIGALNIYGIIANFEILIPNAKFTDCSFDILGMTS